ncbi:CD80 protein, partial [Brachypteracias leptosomus]|nr:CD80 protein [Brachypteracias leptosomus]
ASEEKVVKGKVGEKVGLPCGYEIPSSESLLNYRVYWQKKNTTTEVAHAHSEGKEVNSSKSERYRNRTEMDARNLTLWISPVEILDNGSYQCIVQNRRTSRDTIVVSEKTVTLFVTADFSMPNITTDANGNFCETTEMVVRCSSHGGFPKPQISGTLNNKSAVWNDSWVSKSDLNLYNITAKLWLSVTKDINFTCSVEYNGFAKSTSLLLKKIEDCDIATELPPYNVITASSIIIIIFLLAVTLAARYLPRHGKCSFLFKKQ